MTPLQEYHDISVMMTDIAEAESSLLEHADVRVPIPGRNTHNFGLKLLISASGDVRLERL